MTPLTLTLLDRYHHVMSNGELARPGIAALFEVVAFEAEDPVLRAAARYYVAAGLMHSANATRTEPEDPNARPPSALRAAMRRARGAQRADARRRALNAATGSLAGRAAGATETDARRAALDAATGLSVGVEEVEFPGWGGPDVPTFAEAEADLVLSIRHGTVGATLPPWVTGTRLDGVEESLSDYRGRVVLLDFWATWCQPCVAELPELRELFAEMPADRFALIAISVDYNAETVTRFMEDEPMPWTNWHVGRGSDIGRLLRVQGYPTYVLVDEHGKILSRPRIGFASAAKEAVAKITPPA